MSTIYDAVVNVISTRFEIDPSKVQPDSSFDDLGLDSLSQIELAARLSRQFGVDMSDDDLQEISGVADVVGWLEARGAAV
ncbi:MAG: acyl carrier protein [Solirubrobacteraceae bacterium]